MVGSSRGITNDAQSRINDRPSISRPDPDGATNYVRNAQPSDSNSVTSSATPLQSFDPVRSPSVSSSSVQHADPDNNNSHSPQLSQPRATIRDAEVARDNGVPAFIEFPSDAVDDSPIARNSVEVSGSRTDTPAVNEQRSGDQSARQVSGSPDSTQQANRATDISNEYTSGDNEIQDSVDILQTYDGIATAATDIINDFIHTRDNHRHRLHSEETVSDLQGRVNNVIDEAFSLLSDIPNNSENLTEPQIDKLQTNIGQIYNRLSNLLVALEELSTPPKGIRKPDNSVSKETAPTIQSLKGSYEQLAHRGNAVREEVRALPQSSGQLTQETVSRLETEIRDIQQNATDNINTLEDQANNYAPSTQTGLSGAFKNVIKQTSKFLNELHQLASKFDIVQNKNPSPKVRFADSVVDNSHKNSAKKYANPNQSSSSNNTRPRQVQTNNLQAQASTVTENNGTPTPGKSISADSDVVLAARLSLSEGFEANFDEYNVGYEALVEDIQTLKEEYPIFNSITVDEGTRTVHFPFTTNEIDTIKALVVYDGPESEINDILSELNTLFNSTKGEVGGATTVLFGKYQTAAKRTDGLLESVNKLSSEADKTFNDYRQGALDTPKKVIPRNLQRLAKNPEKALSSLLKKNQGVIIGEVHKDLSPKKLLIDNISSLKNEGVNTIFLEHVLNDFHGTELKEYFNSPEGAPLPLGLEAHLKALDEGHHIGVNQYSFLNLVKAAKENGVEVVAIDNHTSYESDQAKNHDKGNEQSIQRYKLMNHVATQAVQNHNSSDNGDGKWVMLVGSGHLTENLGVPGVSELTGAPAIIVEDSDKNKISKNVSSYRGTEINPDVVISIDASKIPRN